MTPSRRAPLFAVPLGCRHSTSTCCRAQDAVATVVLFVDLFALLVRRHPAAMHVLLLGAVLLASLNQVALGAASIEP